MVPWWSAAGGTMWGPLGLSPGGVPWTWSIGRGPLSGEPAGGGIALLMGPCTQHRRRGVCGVVSDGWVLPQVRRKGHTGCSHAVGAESISELD